MSQSQAILYSIAVLRSDRSTRNAYILTQVMDVSTISFLFRGKAGEVLRFAARTAAANAPVGLVDIEHESFFAHTMSSSSGLTVIVITNAEYPSNIAF